MTEFDRTWYKPGDWSLPAWWTSDAPIRIGFKATTADNDHFLNGPFVRNVLGHKGGMTTLPKTES